MGGSSTEVGRHWRIAYAHALSLGPLDAFLGWHVAEQEAWAGRITESTALNVNRPQLLGGEEDQGGVVGRLNVQFGTADQLPNNYGLSVHGPAFAAYRGVAVAHWEGGRYGANNPYAPDAEYRVERIVAGWEPEPCWYPAKAPVPLGEGTAGGDVLVRDILVCGASLEEGAPMWATSYAVAVPTFVGIEQSTGANIPSALPTFYGSTWAIGGTDAVRYLVSGVSTEFQAGTLSTAFSPRDIVGGPGGFLVHDDALNPLLAAGNPPAVFTALTNDEYAAGNAWPSGLQSAYRSFQAAGYYFVTYNRALWRASDPRGPFTLVAGTHNLEGNPNGDMLQNWGSCWVSGSNLLAVCYQNFSFSRAQVRKSPDVGVSWLNADILVDVEQLGAYRPIQGCNTGAYDVVSATDGAVWTSANNWASPIVIGFSAGGVHHVVGANGFAYIFNGNQYVVFDPETLTASAPVTLPIANVTGAWAGISEPEAPGTPPRYAMNPAHMILEAHCDPDGAGYERDSVDLDHLQVQADWYYANTFGLCWVWDSSKESASQYIERIEEVAACSWARNHADGKWRLTVANGVYDFDSLPIITDDDILSFSKAKLDLSEAINSVSVKYFDPALKEEIITIPVRADDLIKAYGLRHKTYDFLSIPIDHIAARVAQRMLDNHTKERWVFNMDTNRKANGFVKNTYFRLQVPKRGISDMVCIAMEVDHAALKSGGIRLMAHEEIYSLPLTVYTGVQPGGTSGPDKVPKPIVHQRAIEAPYIDLAGSMAADALAALPADAGFAVGMAADPGRSRGFSMLVAPDGGAYVEVSKGAFCPTAVTVAQVTPMDTYVLLAEAQELAGVSVGDLVLIGDELRIVEAVDLGAVAVTLSLACADTVPALHPAGTRLFFYANRAAYDPTEHTEGEALDIKLLTNSSGKQLPEASAVAMDLTMARRKDRPYPPGNLMINGQPFYGTGNTAPPSSGGGGGGGTGTPPSMPPATSNTGAPASTTPGPNGGYADDAPYPIPAPAVFGTDVVDGDFSSPAQLANWRKRDGTALDARWSVQDGRLNADGRDLMVAYGYAWRYSLPYMPLPRYDVTVTATIKADPWAKVRLGVAWGTSFQGDSPNYVDTSPAAVYPDEVTISHTFRHAPTRPGVNGAGAYVVTTFMPVIWFEGESGPYHAEVDDVQMTITPVAVPTTAEALDHLDFDAGTTGWTFLPDPTGTNPVLPTTTVSGGELTVTSTNTVGRHRYAICDDPITLADTVGKYVKLTAEVWCNDTTVHNGVTKGGVMMGICVKLPGGEYTVEGQGQAQPQRGDWTPREWWQRVFAVSPGYTLHAFAMLRSMDVGKSAKVRNIAVHVTDNVID